MDFELSARTKTLKAELEAFMDAFVYPNERVWDEQIEAQPTRWQVPPILEACGIK